MDVTKTDDIENSVREIEGEHGPVDVLISNAGASQRGSVNDCIMDVHHSLMKINYFGPVNLVKGVLSTFFLMVFTSFYLCLNHWLITSLCL